MIDKLNKEPLIRDKVWVETITHSAPLGAKTYQYKIHLQGIVIDEQLCHVQFLAWIKDFLDEKHDTEEGDLICRDQNMAKIEFHEEMSITTMETTVTLTRREASIIRTFYETIFKINA